MISPEIMAWYLLTLDLNWARSGWSWNAGDNVHAELNGTDSSVKLPWIKAK